MKPQKKPKIVANSRATPEARTATGTEEEPSKGPLAIDAWPLAKLIPYEKNARTISAASVEKVALSLEQYGWRQPIVADESGTIIVGHTRLLAAKKLGLETVPVHVARDLSAEQVKAYRLMDNRSHDESLWDAELLGEEIESLSALSVDLDLTGFEDYELDTLMPALENVPRRLYQTESVKLESLTAHPLNYRTHPADQLAHMIHSIEQHGLFRNIVVSENNVILAGHGMVEALRKMGRKRVPILRLPIDPQSPQALKVLIADNDIGDRAEENDRLLTETLREIKNKDTLLGTGYDEMMLANLLFVTRPASEVKSVDAAAEWAGAGMPEFSNSDAPLNIKICFLTEADRERFIAEKGIEIRTRGEKVATWSTWWPYREQNDPSSIRFQQQEQE